MIDDFFATASHTLGLNDTFCTMKYLNEAQEQKNTYELLARVLAKGITFMFIYFTDAFLQSNIQVWQITHNKHIRI